VRELEHADLILHGGDFVAASVLRELGELAQVEAVYGNVDEPALQALLPERRVVEVEGARIGMVHIAGRGWGGKSDSCRCFPVATPSSTATRTSRRRSNTRACGS